jgi:conjugative transfer signal peptidase TraF
MSVGRAIHNFVGLATAAAICVIPLGAWIFNIRINHSASMPVGFWRISRPPSSLHRGDIVLICPHDEDLLRYLSPGSCDDGYEPILKFVAAVPADEVSIGDYGVTVNLVLFPEAAPKTADAMGRPLHPYPPGDYRVGADEFWAFSSSAWGYDSRYIGPMPQNWIVGLARPLFTW